MGSNFVLPCITMKRAGSDGENFVLCVYTGNVHVIPGESSRKCQSSLTNAIPL